MKRPKIRIATLMLLIVIVALASALFVQTRRFKALLAESQARAAMAEMEAKARELQAIIQVEQFQAQLDEQAATKEPSKADNK